MRADDLTTLLEPPPFGLYAAYAGIGSRKTPPDVCRAITRIARGMEARGFTLRSGGAPGADQAFEAGTVKLREIYLPRKGWRGSSSPLAPDTLGSEIWAHARQIAQQFHPAWHRLRSPEAEALQTRNTFQVLGRDLESPARFVIAWTEDGGASGGTGQAIRIARAHGIPVLNLHDPAVSAALEYLS